MYCLYTYINKAILECDTKQSVISTVIYQARHEHTVMTWVMLLLQYR